MIVKDRKIDPRDLVDGQLSKVITGYTVDDSFHCVRCSGARFGVSLVADLIDHGRASIETQSHRCGWCYVTNSLR